MKLLILSTIVLALTGCGSGNQKSKVYRRKIEFYKPKKLKILYKQPEETPLEKYYKTHLIETDIAEIELNTYKLIKLNKDTKKWIVLALQEIKNAKVELARRKAEIAKIKKQNQQLEEMKQDIKEIRIRIEKVKEKRQEEKERRLRS